MMAAVTAKYIVRGKNSEVETLLKEVESAVFDLVQAGNFVQNMDDLGEDKLSGSATLLRAMCEQVEALGISGKARPSVEEILGLSQSPPEQQDEIYYKDWDKNRQHNTE